MNNENQEKKEQKNWYLLKKVNLFSKFTQWKENISFLERDQSGQVSNSLATLKVEKKHTKSEIQVRKVKMSIKELHKYLEKIRKASAKNKL